METWETVVSQKTLDYRAKFILCETAEEHVMKTKVKLMLGAVALQMQTS